MLTQAIVVTLNHFIGQDAWAQDRLRLYSGRTARVTAGPLALTLAVTSDGALAEAAVDVPDVVIVLPPAPGFSGGIAGVMKRAHVTGSVDFAETLAFVLRNLRWDVEEDLSRVVGDVAAHRVVAALRNLNAWQRRATLNLSENLAEYVEHEQRAVIVRPAFVGFRDALLRLRDDIESLEERLLRLETRKPPERSEV